MLSNEVSANPWQDLARSDVTFAYDQIKNNHPGAVDIKDLHTSDWLERGYKEAKSRITRVSSLTDYMLTLDAFLAGFRDPHVSIDFDMPEPDLQWPGFVVSGRAGKVVVVSSKSQVPPIGSEVVACDNVPIQDLLANRVFAFKENPAIEASFDRTVRHLFLYSQNNLLPNPLRDCLFSDGGKRFVLRLQWEKVTQEAERLFSIASGKIQGSPSLSEPAPAVFWLKVPSFSAEPKNKIALENLFRSVNQAQHKIASADAFLIDLRGNTGGASTFGEILTYLLFDKNTLRMAGSIKQPPLEIDWRASSENLAYAENWLNPVSPRYHADKSWTNTIVEGLRSSVLAKIEYFRETVLAPTFDEDPASLPYWRHDDDPASKNYPYFVEPVPLKAKVFVLTDGSCVSACLDFLDYLRRLQGITYLGLATDADTQYMDTRSVELPSQLGSLTFPMKVYRTRQRQPGQVYYPDIQYENIDRTEKSVTDWALDVIKKTMRGQLN